MMPLQCLLSARRASPVILIFSALLSIGLLSSPAASASTAASPKTHQHHQHHAHQHHSSHQEWDRTEIMDENGLFILEWNVVDAKEIVFKITANTGGFIGLGFSYKTGKMANSDLVLAWVDDHTGKPNVLVNNHLPIPLLVVRFFVSGCFCETLPQREFFGLLREMRWDEPSVLMAIVKEIPLEGERVSNLVGNNFVSETAARGTCLFFYSLGMGCDNDIVEYKLYWYLVWRLRRREGGETSAAASALIKL